MRREGSAKGLRSMHHKFRADLKRWRQPWLLLVVWFLVLVSINAWWHSRNQRCMAVQDSYRYLLRVMAFDK